ncbi:MAG: PadR family transcriptional regulator [Caldilineales bacterium]|nr:PadR family transcriptional regulator [Caldilineales bacterium]MCW5857623.1 PadR family transcriptional regulator [Caldilineales bacterium]
MRVAAVSAFGIEHALLGFVHERPVHGYELYQQLSAPSGLWQVWRLKQSHLYALLARLVEQGYLTATVQVQETRPSRKVYTLTDDGRVAFQQWLQDPVGHGRQMRFEFLAKLYWAYRQAPEAALALIDKQYEVCQFWSASLSDGMESASGGQGAPYFSYAVHQFRVNQIESFLGWLAACRQALTASSA